MRKTNFRSVKSACAAFALSVLIAVVPAAPSAVADPVDPGAQLAAASETVPAPAGEEPEAGDRGVPNVPKEELGSVIDFSQYADVPAGDYAIESQGNGYSLSRSSDAYTSVTPDEDFFAKICQLRPGEFAEGSIHMVNDGTMRKQMKFWARDNVSSGEEPKKDAAVDAGVYDAIYIDIYDGDLRLFSGPISQLLSKENAVTLCVLEPGASSDIDVTAYMLDTVDADTTLAANAVTWSFDTEVLEEDDPPAAADAPSVEPDRISWWMIVSAILLALLMTLVILLSVRLSRSEKRNTLSGDDQSKPSGVPKEGADASGEASAPAAEGAEGDRDYDEDLDADLRV